MKLRGMLQLILLASFAVSTVTSSDCRVECKQVHDVAIIMDISSNVNYYELETYKLAVKKLISRFKQGPTGDRISLVTFNDTAQVVFHLNLTEQYDVIYYHIDYYITSTGGSSNFAGALDLTRTDIFPASIPSPPSPDIAGDRQFTPNICFFLAGGPESPTNPGLSIAANALKNVCNVVAVGVGPTVVASEIQNISSNGNSTIFNNMTDLSENLNDLIRDACPSNTTVYKCRNGSVTSSGGNGDWEVYMSSIAPGSHPNFGLQQPNQPYQQANFAPGNGPHIFKVTFNTSGCRVFLHRVSFNLYSHVGLSQNITGSLQQAGGVVLSGPIPPSNNYGYHNYFEFLFFNAPVEYLELRFPANCTQNNNNYYHNYCSGVSNWTADYTRCCEDDCSEICCHNQGTPGRSPDGCCECACPTGFSGKICEIINGTVDYSDCCCYNGGDPNLDENGCCFCEKCPSGLQGRFCEQKPETKVVTRVDHPLLYTLQPGPVDPTTYTRPDNCDWTYTHSSHDPNHPVAEALSSQNGSENSTDSGNATYGGFAPGATNATACFTFNEPVMLHVLAGALVNPTSNFNFLAITFYNGNDAIISYPMSIISQGHSYGNLTFGYPGVKVTKVQFSTVMPCNGSCFGLDDMSLIYTKLTEIKLPKSAELCCQWGTKVRLDTGCAGCKCEPPHTGQYCENGGSPFCKCYNGGTPHHVNGCCQCHCPKPTAKKSYAGRYCQTEVKERRINAATYLKGQNARWTLLASSQHKHNLYIKRALRIAPGKTDKFFFFNKEDPEPRMWLIFPRGLRVTHLQFQLRTKMTVPQNVTLLFGLGEKSKTDVTITRRKVWQTFTVVPPNEKVTSVEFVFSEPCTVWKCYGFNDIYGLYQYRETTVVDCEALAHREKPPCCAPGDLFYDLETEKCRCKPKVTLDDIYRLG